MSGPTPAQRGFRMGRKKIKIARIEDERSRQVTFLKRRNGVMKKAHELAVLTGSDVGLIIFNGQGKLSEFCSGDMNALLRRYTQYSGPAESRGPKYYESLSREKEDEDEDDQDTVSYSAAGTSSAPTRPTDIAADTLMASPKTYCPPAHMPAGSFTSNDLHLLHSLDPRTGAYSHQPSLADMAEMGSAASASAPNPASASQQQQQRVRPGLQTSLYPGDADGGPAGAEMSPVSFSSSRASSIAGHMSSIQIGPTFGLRPEDGMFGMGQPGVLSTANPFSMAMSQPQHQQHQQQPQQPHHLLQGGSLSARRSSFPTQQHVDHSFLAGAQIVRPSTSAGGVQPSLHAMAPSAAVQTFSPLHFAGLQQPHSVTTTASALGGAPSAPPSAWHGLSGAGSGSSAQLHQQRSQLANQFGMFPNRPQMFHLPSDSHTSTSSLSAEQQQQQQQHQQQTHSQHQTPDFSSLGADQDRSQADMVDGINQALKKRKASGKEWNHLGPAGSQLRFSAMIPGAQHGTAASSPAAGPVGLTQRTMQHMLGTPSAGHTLSPAVTSELGRLKEQNERAHSFSDLGSLQAVRQSLGAGFTGAGTGGEAGSAAPSSLTGAGAEQRTAAVNTSVLSLPLSDSHLGAGSLLSQALGVPSAGAGGGVSGGGLVLNTAAAAASASSLSPVSTGTSAPGATATSVTSAPSSTFESPSMSSGRGGGPGCDVTASSSHGIGNGAGGMGNNSSNSLVDAGPAAAAAIGHVNYDSTLAGSGHVDGMHRAGHGHGGQGTDPMDVGLDLNKFVDSMIEEQQQRQQQQEQLQQLQYGALLGQTSSLPAVGVLSRTSSDVSSTGAGLGGGTGGNGGAGAAGTGSGGSELFPAAEPSYHAAMSDMADRQLQQLMDQSQTQAASLPLSTTSAADNSAPAHSNVFEFTMGGGGGGPLGGSQASQQQQQQSGTFEGAGSAA